MKKSFLRSKSSRGFTLVEVTVALSIMSLLFLGTMTMYLTAMRNTVKTQSQIYSSQDAANALQNVIQQLREAQSFWLPTSSGTGPETGTPGFTTLTNLSNSLLSTTYNSETINTAIELTSPPSLTPADNGYPTGTTSIKVQSSGGSGSAFHVIAPYESSGSSAINSVLIYRGDPNGTADAASGTYLWEYTIPANGVFTITSSNPVALCKNVSTAPDAVQFVRPSDGTTAQAYQVECKIISGYYSPINTQQTSEETDGSSTSQLTGKCVYMRDHTSNSTPVNPSVRTSNNVFQYH